jgi:multisubunit Na+/H+ antiporter MnhB subunit
VVTGAILGGPGGALAGGLIGAGVITVHLLVDHPQATLEDGTVLLFTLSEPLNLVPATAQATPFAPISPTAAPSPTEN